MTHGAGGAPRGKSPRVVIEDRCAPAIVECALREAEPYLERTAAYIAIEFPAAAADMMQEARIKLWQLDLGRATQRDAAYVERILCNRMIDVYRSECRGGLTSGWSKHVVKRRSKSLTHSSPSHGKESTERPRPTGHRQAPFTVSQPRHEALDEARQDHRPLHGWQNESRTVQGRSNRELV
jgi:DNA-directed RNA polymerase specialized sigma24 family protein